MLPLVAMPSTLIAILAAGESLRMGSPKLCLPWKKTTVLGHLLTQWTEAGAEKIVVIHPQDPQSAVVQELDRLQIQSTQRAATIAPERGMMGSVVTAAGLAAQDPSLTHLIIALGDQPHIHTETLRKLLLACAITPGKIVRVLFDGKPGHPLALPATVLRDLTTTSCATLRDFLGQQQIPVSDLTCDDSGVLVDMDTPDEYLKASRL